jgi:septum site-determining protein MinC
MDWQHMGIEDTSESTISEAQSNLEREEKQSVQGNIAIKGTRNGLLLTLEPETPFSELLTALSHRLSEAPSFFRGASLALDTRRRDLRTSERTQLEELLANYQMSVTSLEQTLKAKQQEPVSVASDIPPEVALTSAITVEPQSDQAPGQVERLDPRDSDDTLLVRRTIRSGQAIQHASNIVILGDVNPGAEIIAGGDVIVWGALRGMVHAGYPNNESAMVCSLSLAPVQLRIAHLLSRPPDGYQIQARPEYATIKSGQIVVEAWLNGNGRASRK